MAYLFTHFTNEEKNRTDREAIWFAVSRDGLNWTDLGGDEPFLSTQKGTTGIRDPFIVYDEKLRRYFIIATDLCTTKGGDWYAFSHNGSKSLFIWESEDLINWSEERLVEVGIPEAGCVWAPEAVFCEEENKWLVFWASCVKEEDKSGHKQMIYASYTEDFRTFSQSFKFMEAETDLIDTNIVRDGEWYYRFTKDESNKKIVIDRCRSLVPEDGEKYEKIHSDVFADFFGLEGPEAYFIEEKNKWCVIADQYHTWKGYIPFLSDDLSTGEFTVAGEGEYSMGKRPKRHGGVIRISDAEADRLVEAFVK